MSKVVVTLVQNTAHRVTYKPTLQCRYSLLIQAGRPCLLHPLLPCEGVGRAAGGGQVASGLEEEHLHFDFYQVSSGAQVAKGQTAPAQAGQEGGGQGGGGEVEGGRGEEKAGGEEEESEKGGGGKEEGF